MNHNIMELRMNQFLSVVLVGEMSLSLVEGGNERVISG